MHATFPAAGARQEPPRRLRRSVVAAALVGIGWVAISCSSLEEFEHDRAQELAAIAGSAPQVRAAALRDRVAREAMVLRSLDVMVERGVNPARPDLTDARFRAREAMADDCVKLGDALREADDVDGALGAYEAATGLADASMRTPEVAARVRSAALRGKQALWKARHEPARAEAAGLLAVAEERWPSDPHRRAAAVITSARALPEREDLAVLRRVTTSPPAIAAAADASALDGLVATEQGKKELEGVLASMHAFVRGRPLAQVLRDADRVAAAAAPKPPATAAATVAPAPPDPAGGAVLPAPPSSAAAPALPSATGPEPPPLPPAAVTAAPVAPPGKVDVAERLRKLDALRAQKLVSDAEYMRERARILKEGL